MRASRLALALALGCATGNACLLELDHALACGDGVADRLAGEQCDPGDPSSFLEACVGTSHPNGVGACDPVTCQIINDDAQCAFCGDGIIDSAAGEECDGSNIGTPCWGSGEPTCSNTCRLDFSTCDSCGNGLVEPGEECDEVGHGGDIVNPRPCAGANVGTPDEIEPLRSPYQNLPYTSGNAVRCLDNCTYDRTSCGYCGNGEQDGPLRVSILDEAVSLAEVCDGDDFDTQFLDDAFPFCSQQGIAANVDCRSDCLGVTPREGPPCCLPKGDPCPLDSAALRCCYEYAHPGEDACLPVLLPPDGGDSSGDGGGDAVVCR